MDDKQDVRNTKFYEKSLGFSPADLLILEIKKPNLPVIPKKTSIFRKNSRKFEKIISFGNNIDENKYKDPKVRIKLYN